jgi:hypothetical protein
MKYTGHDKEGKEVVYEVPDDAVAELSVDNVPTKMTAKQMAEAANKVTAANKRFEEAAAMRKEAAEGTYITELAKRAETDDTAFRELAKAMGHDTATGENLLRQFRDQQAGTSEEEEEEAPKPAAKSGGRQQMQTVVQQLPADMQNKIQTAYDATMDAGREKGLGMMREALDKHPILGKLKDEQKAFLIGSLDDLKAGRTSSHSMAGFVVSKLVAGHKMSPELLKDGVDHALGTARQLGLDQLVGPSKEVRDLRRDNAIKEMQAGGVGLGPQADALIQTMKADKVPDRKPITDPDAEDVMVARAIQGAYEQAPEEKAEG